MEILFMVELLSGVVGFHPCWVQDTIVYARYVSLLKHSAEPTSERRISSVLRGVAGDGPLQQDGDMLTARTK